jgi:hypothetical protein
MVAGLDTPIEVVEPGGGFADGPACGIDCLIHVLLLI